MKCRKTESEEIIKEGKGINVERTSDQREKDEKTRMR